MLCRCLRRKSHLAILGVVVAMLGLAGACEPGWRAPVATQTFTPSTTSTSVLSPTSVAVPFWRGIVPGQTTREEVGRILGRPDALQVHENLELLYYYPNGWKSFAIQSDYRILLRQDIVQLVISTQSLEIPDTLSDMVQKFGAYDKMIEYEGVYSDVYVFATRGIAVASPRETLLAVEYFAPMSVEDYLASWGRYHPDDKPWPTKFPGHPTDVGILPEQSRREDVLRVYGDPDYIGPMERWGYPPGSDPAKDKLQVLGYHVPASEEWKNILGDEFVSFVVDNRDVVRLVHVWGNPRPEYTLEDVLARYGEPEWMYRRAKGPWSEFPDTPICYFYPEKGVSVQTTGYPNIRPTDRVHSEWFYAPMSWNVYWSSWGAEPRIGWSLREQMFRGELTKWTGFSANE